MNRPRRPSQFPARRRPSGPPPTGAPGGGPPRRRSALDVIPANVEPPFEVLGGAADRQAILASAQPMELVVIQGFTREIEDAFQKHKGRGEDFWVKHSSLLEQARKLDEVLAKIQARKANG